ncbi:YbjN domain-containing protein [Schaalia vaccimaxillae]|uniref:YbjN domain-containing protein n=1 Tax=Schaalia vaccimaxillae TaxID=183916 RepID=UPI0003B5741E|nr:YbjN domain-containing protein [Schaalia vaccimaxillae]
MKNDPYIPDAVRPISQERLCRLFDNQGWFWHIDDDGDLAGNWDDNAFYFRFSGEQKEVLSILSFMRLTVPEEREEELEILIEDWHRERLWPKAYFRRNEDGSLRVMGEVNADYEFGATDAQLLQQCQCALSTTLQLFAHVAGRFELSDPEKGQEETAAE